MTRRPGDQVNELLRQRRLRRMFEDRDRIRDGRGGRFGELDRAHFITGVAAKIR